MILENPIDLDSFSVHSWQVDDITYLYFLWFEGECVYIGQTTKLYGRIEQHLNDKLFDRVTYKKYFDISSKEMLKIETANIDHFRPLFNKNRLKGIIKRENFCFLRTDKGSVFLIKDHFSHIDGLDLVYYYYDGDVYYEHDFSSEIFKRYENDVLKQTVVLPNPINITSYMEGLHLKHVVRGSGKNSSMIAIVLP